MGLDEISRRVSAHGTKNTKTQEMRDKKRDLKQPPKLGMFVNGRIGWGVRQTNESPWVLAVKT